jgi:hypothetical protein
VEVVSGRALDSDVVWYVCLASVPHLKRALSPNFVGVCFERSGTYEHARDAIVTLRPLFDRIRFGVTCNEGIRKQNANFSPSLFTVCSVCHFLLFHSLSRPSLALASFRLLYTCLFA